MLAPLCTASEASFWLIKQLRKDRRDVDTDQDFVTRFTVRAVYKAFVARGYKAKTLAQAQKDNKEKAALIARKNESMAKALTITRPSPSSTPGAPATPSAEQPCQAGRYEEEWLQVLRGGGQSI